MVLGSSALLVGSVPVFAGDTTSGSESQSVNKTAQSDSEQQVIQSFISREVGASEIVTIGEQRKKQVMFFLGVPLLVFILTTAVLGVAMGIYGKNVYVAHMIFAGLSVTLAIAHSIVGIVWFYPF